MSLLDEFEARLALVEARVGALEEEGEVLPGDPPKAEKPQFVPWSRWKGSWLSKVEETYIGNETCEFCEEWNHTRQKWGKDLSHDQCQFHEKSLYATCALRPKLYFRKPESCGHFYPAERFWRPVDKQRGRRVEPC